RALTERISTITIPAHQLQALDTSFFFDYSIFPPNIMMHLTEWQHERRSIRPGDTIVQQVYLPPWKGLSQKLVFGVRVCEVKDEPGKKSFSYETLQVHVEKGISSFSIEQSTEGIIIQIQTWSAPGHVLSRVLAPVFSLPYQAFCTRRALMYMKEQLKTECG